MADKWYSDSDIKTAFQSVLIDAGVLSDTDDVKTFNAKPFRYNTEYEAWEAAEYPDTDSEEWDDFVEAITADEEDNEEEDNEEEEESE